MSAARLAAAVLVAALAASCGPSVEIPAVAPGAIAEEAVATHVEQARRAVRDAPRSAEAWGRLGRVFHAHDFDDEAHECYLQAIALDSGDYRWPYLAALTRWKSDAAQATALFEQAVALEPDNPALFVNFGDFLLDTGDSEGASEQYRAALERRPTFGDALLGLARVALLSDDPRTALAHLTAVRAIPPDRTETHLLLAQVHERLGDSEQAATEQQLAAQLPAFRPADPAVDAVLAEGVSATALRQRGLRLLRQAQPARAERQFRELLTREPVEPGDQANLARALFGQGKLDEAIEAFQEANRLAPEDPVLLNDLGAALLEGGRVDDAAEAFESSLRLDADNARVVSNLGLARLRQGRPEDAAARLREALALDPELDGARAQLGIALAEAGRDAEAVREFELALERDERNVPALYELSQIAARNDRHGEAIRWLQKAIGVDPRRAELRMALAWLLATAPRERDRDGVQAVEIAREVREALPERPDAADVLAAALAETGQFEEATEEAQRGLELAREQEQDALAAAIEVRLQRYREGRAFRD